MDGLTVSALMAWPHEYFIPIPQFIVLSTLTYLLPDRSDQHSEFSAHLGEGGWRLNHDPSRTAASAVVPVSTSTTSATKSSAILCLRVPMAVVPSPVPVSPVGYLISAALKFPLVKSVHRLYGPPDITDHQLPIVSA